MFAQTARCASPSSGEKENAKERGDARLVALRREMPYLPRILICGRFAFANGMAMNLLNPLPMHVKRTHAYVIDWRLRSERTEELIDWHRRMLRRF